MKYYAHGFIHADYISVLGFFRTCPGTISDSLLTELDLLCSEPERLMKNKEARYYLKVWDREEEISENESFWFSRKKSSGGYYSDDLFIFLENITSIFGVRYYVLKQNTPRGVPSNHLNECFGGVFYA